MLWGFWLSSILQCCRNKTWSLLKERLHQLLKCGPSLVGWSSSTKHQTIESWEKKPLLATQKKKERNQSIFPRPQKENMPHILQRASIFGILWLRSLFDTLSPFNILFPFLDTKDVFPPLLKKTRTLMKLGDICQPGQTLLLFDLSERKLRQMTSTWIWLFCLPIKVNASCLINMMALWNISPVSTLDISRPLWHKHQTLLAIIATVLQPVKWLNPIFFHVILIIFHLRQLADFLFCFSIWRLVIKQNKLWLNLQLAELNRLVGVLPS